MNRILLFVYALLLSGVAFAQDSVEMPAAADNSKIFQGTIYYKTSISGNGIDYKQAAKQANKEYVLKYGNGFIRYEETDAKGIYTLYDLRTSEAYEINPNNQTYVLLKDGAGSFMDMDSTYIKDISKTDTIVNYHCVRFKSTSRQRRYDVSSLYWVTPDLQINPTVYEKIDPRLVSYKYKGELQNKGIMLKTVTRYKLKRKTIYSTKLYAYKIDETRVPASEFAYPDELGYRQKR